MKCLPEGDIRRLPTYGGPEESVPLTPSEVEDVPYTFRGSVRESEARGV